MKSIERAIKYFEDEIRSRESAPAIENGDWMQTLDACKLAVAALKEQQERQNPKPLTVEEMWAMLEEPVWVAVKDSDFGYWSIMSRTLMGLADGFKAYRYKPEEVMSE